MVRAILNDVINTNMTFSFILRCLIKYKIYKTTFEYSICRNITKIKRTSDEQHILSNTYVFTGRQLCGKLSVRAQRRATPGAPTFQSLGLKGRGGRRGGEGAAAKSGGFPQIWRISTLVCGKKNFNVGLLRIRDNHASYIIFDRCLQSV